MYLKLRLWGRLNVSDCLKKNYRSLDDMQNKNKRLLNDVSQ